MHSEKAMHTFQNILHLNTDFSRPYGQMLLTIVLDGVEVSRFQILKSKGPGKFVSPRTTGVKILKMCYFLELRSLTRSGLNIMNFDVFHATRAYYN